MKMTPEQKFEIIKDHYETAYKKFHLKVHPDISKEQIETLYQEMLKLHRSENYYKEKRHAQAFLQIVK